MEPDADGLFPTCSPIPSVNPDGSELAFRPEWRTEAVVGLARGIVEDGAFERMPILADALEEAGCDLPSVLLHCRDPIRHEGDCWVLEAILRRNPPTLELPTEVILQLLANLQRHEAGRRVVSPDTVRFLRRFRRLLSLGCLTASVLLVALLFAFVLLARHLDR